MQLSDKRNRLMPWLIGAGIIIAADLWVIQRMFATSCPAPGFVEAIVVIIMPVVYLVLMYMTLRSQD